MRLSIVPNPITYSNARRSAVVAGHAVSSALVIRAILAGHISGIILSFHILSDKVRAAVRIHHILSGLSVDVTRNILFIQHIVTTRNHFQICIRIGMRYIFSNAGFELLKFHVLSSEVAAAVLVHHILSVHNIVIIRNIVIIEPVNDIVRSIDPIKNGHITGNFYSSQ